MASSPIKWTPNERPTTNDININHLLDLSFSKSSAHLRPNQKRTDKIKVAIAYTSASTALYQKLSVKVNVNEPRKDAPKILTESFLSSIFFVLNISFPIKLIDQKRNIIVRELEKTDIIFIA